MRRRAIAFTCGAAAIAIASCGPVAGPPPSSLPINACPAHACTAYASADPLTCSAGACVSNSSFDFTLVVSLPESSFYAPGMTVPIASFLQATQSQCEVPANLPNASCLQIPSVVEPAGFMIVETKVVNSVGAAGAYIDTSASGATQWSLPVHVQYRPLWPPLDPKATTPAVSVEAASIGLPLYPIDATLSAAPGLFPAPRGTSATQWRAPLAPGIYERDVVPDDDDFPVLTTAPLAAAGNTDSTPISSVDTEPKDITNVARTLTIARTGGSLAGFTAYLRDATTLRRASCRVTFDGDARGPITLNTFSEPLGSSKLELVVAPPAGSAIPYLADPVVVDHLGPIETFPALPAPVAVSGTVEGPDLTPIRASLVIDSTRAGAASGITLADPSSSTAPFMHYSTTAQTDANGHYAVTLPPGTYDVFVMPIGAASAGATSVPLDVRVPPAGEPSVAAGKDLEAAPFGILYGVATIADGRPLAGATVQAQPAVSLAATVDPRRWPRTKTAKTDANGAFAMFVDPGLYDVVVQPADGTGFPWTTISSQTVAPGKPLALAPITVPAPVSIDLVLHDPGDNPLVRTIVRAFAPASSAKSATPGAPLPVIEIGSWMTDTSGHLTMLLAPPH